MDRHRMNIFTQFLTALTFVCLVGGSSVENLQARERTMTSNQTGIPISVEAQRAGLSNDRQVTTIADVQPRDYPTGSANRGRKVYNNICQSCHGPLAKGAYGPTLQQNLILQDDDRFWTTVLQGRGNMPAFEERLGSQKIADVQAYLKSLKPAPPP